MENFGYTFGLSCILLAIFLMVTGKADADPYAPYCFDERLCSTSGIGDDGLSDQYPGPDLSDSYYCPGMSGRVGPFEACDALVTGPYAPGGLVPNEGIQGNG